MMPRLQAEERLSTITVIAAGNGCLDRRDHHRVISRLEEAARVEKPKRQKAGPAMLAAMGISVSMPEELHKKAVDRG